MNLFITTIIDPLKVKVRSTLLSARLMLYKCALPKQLEQTETFKNRNNYTINVIQSTTAVFLMNKWLFFKYGTVMTVITLSLFILPQHNK